MTFSESQIRAQSVLATNVWAPARVSVEHQTEGQVREQIESGVSRQIASQVGVLRYISIPR